jgi:hypothetical protein
MTYKLQGIGPRPNCRDGETPTTPTIAYVRARPASVENGR